jgi:hypothetical protein
LHFDFEPGVIGAVRALPLGELFLPGYVLNPNAIAGNNWDNTKAGRVLL